MVVKDLRFVEPEDYRYFVVADNRNLCELVRLDDTEADSGILLDLALKVLSELLVALPGDHRQRIHFETAQALAVLIYTETQAAPDRLPPFALGLNVSAAHIFGKHWGCPTPRAVPNGKR